ncbi:MAG: hypothetical protein ACC645_20820 [Pirellulales bacterium]
MHLTSVFRRSPLLLSCLLIGSALSGCGEKAPHLEVTVTSPVGRPGVCALCNEKIDQVTQDHLIAIDGVEHIVCNKKCETDLKKWLAEQ